MKMMSKIKIAALVILTVVLVIYLTAVQGVSGNNKASSLGAGCRTYDYRYISEGVIEGLGSDPTPSRQEWVVSTTSLGSMPNHPEQLLTRVNLGSETRAAYYVLHNAKGEILRVHKRSDIKDSIALTNYSMLSRLPLLRPDLLEIDQYETHIQDQSFNVKGDLRQSQDGWIWEGRDLKSTMPTAGDLALSKMTISYHGYISPAGFENIKGVQRIAYSITQQSIKSNENFSLEKTRDVLSSDCQTIDIALLGDYAEVNLEKMTESVSAESTREYFEKNFDLHAKLSEAITLSRAHIPGEPSSSELLKSLSNLSQYYQHFPGRQKEIFEKLDSVLSDPLANPGERLFLTDLTISFGSDESVEKIFQLVSDHKFPTEPLENRVIASFNHVEKPSLDMYRHFLSEYNNDSNPIDTRTTSLLAAASISGHFENESRDTARMLNGKIRDSASSRDEKNLAVSALGNIGVEDSLRALYSNALSKDREIAEEAIWGLAKSQLPLAEKFLMDIVKTESLDDYKLISAAFGLVKRSVPSRDEDSYRKRLDTLYIELSQEPKRTDKMLSTFWNGMINRGYISSPSERQDHNRLFLNGIKIRRELHVWERAN